MSHFWLMFVYALLVSVFFSVLWRRERRAQARLFLQLFLGLLGGGILVAWLMYPFPSRPPGPSPTEVIPEPDAIEAEPEAPAEDDGLDGDGDASD